MCGFFFSKIQILFFSFENKPWGSKSSAARGQNRVLPGLEIECIHTKSVLVCMHSILTLGALYFDPRQHAILTPNSTYFDPQGLLSKLKKAINHNFKRNLEFLKKAIHLILFLRFHGKKIIYFNLGIPLKVLNWISHPPPYFNFVIFFKGTTPKICHQMS